MNFGNHTLLLSTKFKMPTPRKNYILRSRLFARLDAAPDLSVVFIQGGAGTGKTTLAASYIREKQIESAAWLALDAEMNDLYSFWLYFSTALCPFLRDNTRFIEYLKVSPEVRNVEQLVILLINQIKTDQDYYMVLDDVHTLNNEDLIKSFEGFLQNMPENLHFFMLSRMEPPIYLGPLAMSGKLLYIDSSMMYLTEQESLDFLQKTLQVEEGLEQLRQLNQYAEGWIGGLQLVVAARSMGKYSNTLFRAGGGIATAYLNREILEQLNEEEKEFLIETSAFPFFNYGISAALFPTLTPDGFHLRMEELIRRNLFIMILDEEKEIYRYHNIFSEYLKQQFGQLPELKRKELRTKVALYLEDSGNLMEALQIYLENEDYQSLIRLIKNDATTFEIVPYLKRIPLEILSESLELSILAIMYELWTLSDLERIRNMYVIFKAKYGDHELIQMFSYVEAYFSQEKALLPRMTPISLELIESLDMNNTWKAFILIENASGLFNVMNYKEAENCIRLSLSIVEGKNEYVEFFARNQLAQLCEEVGRLNDSLDWYLKNEMKFMNSYEEQTMESNYYFGLLGVYMRRMELEQAQEILNVCESLTDQSLPFYQLAKITLEYHQAEMLFLRGEDEAGKTAVIKLASDYESYSILTLLRLLYELLCVDLMDESMADYVLEEISFDEDFSRHPFTRILHARLLFQKGEVELAGSMNAEVLAESRRTHNDLRPAEAGILQIYMLRNTESKAADWRSLQNLLLEVIHYSCENRIRMPFYLDRRTLVPLLERLILETEQKPSLMNREEFLFTQETLKLCRNQKNKEMEKSLLTNREQEILTELASGITNREISEKLCISQATVKTHVLSIYSKLGVSSRLKAVEAARSQGFLQ